MDESEFRAKLAERDAEIESYRHSLAAMQIEGVKQMERAEAAEARVRELQKKEGAADLCLQAVSEARNIIREHLGGNCAFLDDDLVRWVARGIDELKVERDTLRAQLEAIEKLPTIYLIYPEKL